MNIKIYDVKVLDNFETHCSYTHMGYAMYLAKEGYGVLKYADGERVLVLKDRFYETFGDTE